MEAAATGEYGSCGIDAANVHYHLRWDTPLSPLKSNLQLWWQSVSWLHPQKSFGRRWRWRHWQEGQEEEGERGRGEMESVSRVNTSIFSRHTNGAHVIIQSFVPVRGDVSSFTRQRTNKRPRALILFSNSKLMFFLMISRSAALLYEKEKHVCDYIGCCYKITKNSQIVEIVNH